MEEGALAQEQGACILALALPSTRHFPPLGLNFLPIEERVGILDLSEPSQHSHCMTLGGASSVQVRPVSQQMPLLG